MPTLWSVHEGARTLEAALAAGCAVHRLEDDGTKALHAQPDHAVECGACGAALRSKEAFGGLSFVYADETAMTPYCLCPADAVRLLNRQKGERAAVLAAVELRLGRRGMARA